LRFGNNIISKGLVPVEQAVIIRARCTESEEVLMKESMSMSGFF